MLSAFIICYNEAHQIRRALKSVEFCDEIIVVDSGSTDGTLEIVKEFTEKIFHRPWTGFVEQKRYALSLCNNPWVLNIDADEEVSEELKHEIQSVLKNNDTVSGFEINRVVWHLGKWFRKGGWYPEYRLRLLKKEKTTWGGNDPHEHAIVTGEVKRLHHELLHYSFKDLHDHLSRLQKYARVSADGLFKKGRRANLFDFFIRPWARFLKLYFVKRGYAEGMPGLVISLLESYYVVMKYIYLWDKNRTNRIP